MLGYGPLRRQLKASEDGCDELLDRLDALRGGLEPPDAFEQIVGVPVEAWMSADTPEKFAELLRRRDDPPCCTVDHTHIDVYAYAHREPIQRIRNEPCNGVHR